MLTPQMKKSPLRFFSVICFKYFPYLIGEDYFGEMEMKKAPFVQAAFQLSEHCRIKLFYENINNFQLIPHLTVHVVPLYYQMYGKDAALYMKIGTTFFSLRK